MRRLLRSMHCWFRRRGGPAILMYHRIAAPDVDPWGPSVSPERFTEQVQALRARRTVLSMDSFVSRLQSGDLPHDAVALTFDDGYLDNLCQAKPILEAADVPATVFLTTGRIGTGEAFWWDELARMALPRAEPLSASVRVGADGLSIDLPPIDPEMEPRVEEIQRSRMEAEALSALPVTGFAYPHGDRDVETIDMVRRAGYRWACSSCEATIGSQRADPHDLSRIGVGNWRADVLFAKLGAASE